MALHTRDSSIGRIPQPADPTVQDLNRHRRGLSLDQGVTQRRQHGPTYLELSQNKPQNVPQIPRPSTPIKQLCPRR